METLWFKTLPSTHNYLKNMIKNRRVIPPCVVGANVQSNGVGSRGNSWKGKEGNLYFSFCIEMESLPKDLRLESISIYFSWVMRETLHELGSLVWIKWPNDFYLKELKVGGVITTKIGDKVIGSMGINILNSPDEFGILDLRIAPEKLVELFMNKLKLKMSWKDVFSKFKIEFHHSISFAFNFHGKKRLLADATLLEDGSIRVADEIIYSLR